MAFPVGYNPKLGKYTVEERDELFDRINAYPAPATASDGDVPVFRDDGINWEPQTGGGGGSSGVSSFNGRTGPVMPQKGDYNADDVGAVSQAAFTQALSQKADAATVEQQLALKAAKGATFSVELTAESWSNGTQTVRDARFLASGYAYIYAPASGSYAAYATAQVYAEDVTTDGSMVFHAITQPDAAITVNILMQEASEDE